MILVLPLPDSPNRGPSHHMARHAVKNEYRERCWIAAVRAVQPKAEQDLPAKVVVRSTFYIRNRRDEDNLKASLKACLDTLKARQTGKCDWRNGLYTEKGYFIDDDPDRCHVAEPRQFIDRRDPRLVLEIEAA